MASTGPTGFTTFVQGLTARDDWVNMPNLTVQDGVPATCALTSNSTEALRGSNAGLAVPAGSIITGIEITIRRRRINNGGSTTDIALQLAKNGVISGTARPSASTWATSYETITYGDPTDLWGLTWTPADVNSSTTGVNYRVGDTLKLDSIEIDFIGFNVYYGVPITGTGAIAFGAPALAAVGTETISGTGAVAIGAPALAAFGGLPVTGTGAVTIGAPSIAGVYFTGPPRVFATSSPQTLLSAVLARQVINQAVVNSMGSRTVLNRQATDQPEIPAMGATVRTPTLSYTVTVMEGS